MYFQRTRNWFLGKRKVLLCEKLLWCYTWFVWNWHFQNSGLYDRQYIFLFGGRVFFFNRQLIFLKGYWLFSYSSQFVSIFIRGGLHSRMNWLNIIISAYAIYNIWCSDLYDFRIKTMLGSPHKNDVRFVFTSSCL